MKWLITDDSELLALVAWSENANPLLDEQSKQKAWSPLPHPEI